MHLLKRADIQPITVKLLMQKYLEDSGNKQDRGKSFSANSHRNYDFLLILLNIQVIYISVHMQRHS